MAFVLEEREVCLITDFFNASATYNCSFFAPFLLKYETINVCKSVASHQQIPISHMLPKIHQLSRIHIEYSLDVPAEELFSLSLEKNISVYDAAYVWLAKEKDASLCTLDTKLQKKVRGYVEILDLGQISNWCW